MRRHEIPTHLEAPDRLLLGLTSKQVMQLMGAAAGAYGLLDSGLLPIELRLPLAAVAAMLGALLALVRPGGRAAEEWLLLLLVHLAGPRRMVWRPCPAPVVETVEGWAAHAPRVGWAEGAAHVR